MLDNILKSAYDAFAEFAEVWLAEGAASCAIHFAGHPQMRWPAYQGALRSELKAVICLDEEEIGALHVQIVPTATHKRRLNSQARLISEILRVNRNQNRLISELINSQDTLFTLNQLNQTLNGVLIPDEIARKTTAELVKIFDVELSALLLKEDDASQIAVHLSDPSTQYHKQLENYFHIVSATQQELLMEAEADEAEGKLINNLLAVPIFVNYDVVAVLVLVNKRNGHFFTPDIKIAHSVAQQIGPQLENARMHKKQIEQAQFETEMASAERIHQKLLPRKKLNIEGLEYAATSRFAFQVGGDFYDYGNIGGNKTFWFVVGDVSGKGFSAALLMSTVRTALRTIMHGSSDSKLHKVVERLNDELFDDFVDMMMFTTLFVGKYDANKKLLTYVNAGHSPIIFAPHQSDSLSILKADDMPIGILKSVPYTTGQIALHSSDTLIVATDGIVDAQNPREEMFGMERFMDIADRVKHEDPDTIISVILKNVDGFSGTQPRSDDQTLLVLKVE